MASIQTWSDFTTVKIEYITVGSKKKPQFVGETPPGNATSVSAWRIKKITYNGDGDITDVKWANKTSLAFTVAWDDRAALSYS